MSNFLQLHNGAVIINNHVASSFWMASISGSLSSMTLSTVLLKPLSRSIIRAGETSWVALEVDSLFKNPVRSVEKLDCLSQNLPPPKSCHLHWDSYLFIALLVSSRQFDFSGSNGIVWIQTLKRTGVRVSFPDLYSRLHPFPLFIIVSLSRFPLRRL